MQSCNLRCSDYFSLVCTINCYVWTHVTMLDVDVGHTATQCDTWQLLPCNHLLTHTIMYDNVKLYVVRVYHSIRNYTGTLCDTPTCTYK